MSQSKTDVKFRDLEFEIGPVDFNFKCNYGVFTKGGESSMCYVTSEIRGKFIAAALEAFFESGKAEEWIKENE